MALSTKKFNRKSPVPLYFQLKEIIKDNIEKGTYQEGDKLPSERIMAEKFSISRMTVRQATNELVHEGYLERKPGQGTFVARQKFVQGLLELTSFTEDMRKRGLLPSSSVISFDVIQPTASIADNLAIVRKQNVYRLERLRLADDEPMALEIVHLPEEKCPGLKEVDFIEGSLYKTLNDHFGIILNQAEETLEGSLASSYEARLLNIQQGDPVILRERLTYDTNEQPVEFVKSIYRADRYKFHVLLRNN